ncbi:trypsin-like peptidase domain-containing protein [Roseibacillus ishigakijimensis]|uniref:Trypsin-like peptidase domain-containing protein n=1 Tax=Roseibacillus ishigakijimensis TaxID=454146 RepID=A0A934RMM3_9BACT|nr:trypsin-like peptidase domain-containing protein [Roseibacillus ishigakijimensis]MBK1832437.1 trypsin-like peptidase domain-containing protein [Roseibacillus ishigakijimensis]
MKAVFARFAALLLVFLVAFGTVLLIRQWQESRGGGAAAGLSELRRGQFRPEDYTLKEMPRLGDGDVELLARLNSEYTRLVGSVVPSVVSIDTVGEQREQFSYLGQVYERSLQTTGIGSGVIVSEEGHVVTNEHVIDGTVGMKITLHDGRSFPARLIGKDSALDIAVLRIEGEGPFEALNFGNSDVVQPGEMVFAVGNPFGLGETVTQGIISAKERTLSDRQRDLFQTDAAINPGNSGGPLVNYRGEIIGINVAIYSPDEENQAFAGVGFSIPSNDVRETFTQILERGRPVRGFLGLMGSDLNSRVRYELGYPQGPGIAIDEVVPGSPAELAGIQPNDIVRRYGGQVVGSLAQFISLIQRTQVGEEVELEVWRFRENLDLVATIADYDEWRSSNLGQDSERPPTDSREVLQRVGLLVRELSVLERMRGGQGVLVVDILPDSLAAEAGVLEGDLILAINGRRMLEATQLLARLISSAPSRETELVIRRGPQALKVTLPRLQES